MKYVLILCSFCLLGCLLQANWKIGNIINSSDLTLQSAWYVQPTKGVAKPKYIEQLSDRLQAAADKKDGKVTFDYKVAQGSDGVCLIQASNDYQIKFDQLLPWKVHYPRSGIKSNKKYLGKESCNLSKHNYCARVFVQKGSVESKKFKFDQKPLSYVAQGYQAEGQLFDVSISGSKGNYSVSLQTKAGSVL